MNDTDKAVHSRPPDVLEVDLGVVLMRVDNQDVGIVEFSGATSLYEQVDSGLFVQLYVEIVAYQLDKLTFSVGDHSIGHGYGRELQQGGNLLVAGELGIKLAAKLIDQLFIAFGARLVHQLCHLLIKELHVFFHQFIVQVVFQNKSDFFSFFLRYIIFFSNYSEQLQQGFQ